MGSLEILSQVMAMGTLALCFNNPRVFTGEGPSPAATFLRSVIIH